MDQSGGSTPEALAAHGIGEDAWSTDDEMFQLVHQMRMRIITAKSFNDRRIVGAILFEDTLERKIASKSTAEYLWNVKNIAPFLKVDRGPAAEADGVQLMNPNPTLADSLSKAKQQPIFNTKMRSVIRLANPSGINAIVDQQFETAMQIIDAGLMPILEPEIDIHSPEKTKSEQLLHQAIIRALQRVPSGQAIMLKLTLPETDNRYEPLVSHPQVFKVVALSGGYSQEEANIRLTQQQGVAASLSRPLAQGLHAGQTEKQFESILARSIDQTFAASTR